MSVGTHCHRPILAVRPETSLRGAAQIMDEQQAGLLLVAEAGHVLGSVTDRALVLALSLSGAERDAGACRVSEVMAHPAIAVAADAPLRHAMILMHRSGLRRLPVTDANHQALGVIEADDVLVCLAAEIASLAGAAIAQRGHDPGDLATATCRQHPIADHYLRECIRVSADAPAASAAAQMREHSAACVIAESASGEPVGLITDRDLAVRAVAKGLDLRRTPVSAVMSAPLISADPSCSLHGIIECMRVHGIRRIPILQEGRLLGMVGLEDLLRALGGALAAVGEVEFRAQHRPVRRSDRWERGLAGMARHAQRIGARALRGLRSWIRGLSGDPRERKAQIEDTVTRRAS